MARYLSLLLISASTFWGFALAGNFSENYNKTDLFSIVFKEKDLEYWEPPKELTAAFPYYWSGFDEDCRPIWIGELGQWDLSKFVSKGEESLKAIQKLIHQGFYRLVKSIKETPPGCEPANQIVVIYDADGFNYNQVTNGKVISYFLNVAKVYVPIFMKYMESIYFINTNFMFEGIVSVARPLLGSLMERVEVYGPNQSKWLPKLLKKLPRDQLPPHLGGNKGFKPLKMYGSSSKLESMKNKIEE